MVKTISKGRKLPFFRRPFLSRKILEVGPGHNPFAGITHAVDKYPDDNTQRDDHLTLPENAVFSEGDLEHLPFGADEKFDFIYLSHVFEHVHDPEKAIGEINRCAVKGYFETPTPLREQLTCPIPLDPADFHTLFCWVTPENGAVHAVMKSDDTLGNFCGCENGRLAENLFRIRGGEGYDLEKLLPSAAKYVKFFFRTPLRLMIHKDFKSACQAGFCGYHSAEILRWRLAFPFYFVSKRMAELRRITGEFL